MENTRCGETSTHIETWNVEELGKRRALTTEKAALTKGKGDDGWNGMAYRIFIESLRAF